MGFYLLCYPCYKKVVAVTGNHVWSETVPWMLDHEQQMASLAPDKWDVLFDGHDDALDNEVQGKLQAWVLPATRNLLLHDTLTLLLPPGQNQQFALHQCFFCCFIGISSRSRYEHSAKKTKRNAPSKCKDASRQVNIDVIESIDSHDCSIFPSALIAQTSIALQVS